MARREFLRSVTLVSAGVAVIPSVLLAGNGAGACAPTTSDIEGPYYLANSPMRVMLAHPDEPGTRLVVSGQVFYNDCITPVVGAMVDVWAANNSGCYNNNNECSPHTDDRYNLRGRMVTDAEGRYSYETVKPGWYLNGATYRPSHIHYKFSAPGRQPVTTQLYFEGDPYNAEDPWASTPEAAARIIPLVKTADGVAGTFDIVLGLAPPGSSAPYDRSNPERCELLGNTPNPFTGYTLISYRVSRAERVDLAIYDMLGRRVRTLVSSVHGAGTFAEQWDGTDDAGNRSPDGVYTCRLQVASVMETLKIVLAK